MSGLIANYLDKAYRLAFFINPDKEAALLIAKQALAKLEVTSNAQFKRYYYRPTGRSGKASSKTHRNRVVWEEPHLLQRLLYAESDALEKKQEAAGDASLRQEDMAVRFIKYLVKVTLRRNSFYVTLGVSRLLHNFSTTETMDLFALLIQDPERVRDDFYYRSRKKRLMEECRERFGKLLSTVRGYRGEQRFEEVEKTPSLIDLVRTCLRQFTPWDTDCVLKEKPDPNSWKIPDFYFEGEDPDEEHTIEINRIHSVIHPDCFHHLTHSLNLGAPEERLSVPQFNLAQGTSKPSFDRLEPPDLDDGHHLSVERFLDDQGNRRRDAKPETLLIKADGYEIARFNPKTSKNMHFRVEEGTDMIEVYSGDGTLLAVHLLTSSEPGRAESLQETVVLLEAGQEITFGVVSKVEEDTEHFEVEIGYRETQWARAAGLAGSRIAARFRRSFDLSDATGRRFVPVFTTSLIVLAAAFLLLRNPAEPEHAPGQGLTVQNSEPAIEPGEDTTRSLNRAQAGLPLGAVQKIYIDPLGEDRFGERLRLAIMEHIKTSERFSVSPERDKADAVLKDVSEFEAPHSDTTISLSLVNVDGEEVWKGSINVSDRSGADPENLGLTLVHRLLREASTN